MSSLSEYKCPSCGSTLDFSPVKGKLVCGSCGNEYDVDAIKAYYKTDDPDAQQQSFDWGAYRSDKDSFEPLDNVNVYICNSCGAAIEADRTTAATACPYYGNNVIMDANISGSLKPNAIIPFKIKPNDLPQVIRNFCKGKKLLPKGFFNDNKIGKLQGIYVPFWLFNCHVDGEATYTATRVRRYRQGQYDVTDTSYFLLDREGELSFDKIPVDASVRMDNDLMDSVEPFDYSALVDFDPGYLSGFLAERFDTDPDSELNRASLRMKNTAAASLSRTAVGYTTVVPKSSSIHIDRASVKYALLPVYLLNCTYNGQNYRYAINGQTGKVVGELPISKSRRLGFFFGSAAIASAIAFVLLHFIF